MDYRTHLTNMPAPHRLLFLSHRLPFPPHSGADIRTFNVWKELASDWEIDAIVVHNRAEDVPNFSVRERAAELSHYGRVTIVGLEAQQSVVLTAMAHTRAILRGVPYLNETFRGNEFSSQLTRHLFHNRYGLVHVDSIALLHALPLLGDLPIVLTHHNIESDLLDRRARFASNRLVRSYLSLQASRLRRAEAHWASRVALNVCVSEQDAQRLREIAPSARVATVPNAVSFDPASRPVTRDGRERTGLFVGGLNWFPNADALSYFAEQIDPAFVDRGISFPTTWIGKASEAQRATFSRHERIQVLGYAPDIDTHMDRAMIFIAPLRVGGGTRLKILDAWAAGVPVVSTTMGCEGLGAEHGRELYIADSSEEFVSSVHRLLTSPEQWHAMVQHARTRLQEHFTWEAIGAELRAHYAMAAARAHPAE